MNSITQTMKSGLTKGSVTRNLLVISSPITMGMLFRSVRDLVDLMWIGRISSEAVAAVAIFLTIHWMAVVLNEIIGISSLSLVSQLFGAKDRKQTQLVIEQTIAFKAFLGIIAALPLLVALEPLVSFFTDDAEVLKLALEYGYIRIISLPLLFALASINTVLRSVGNASLSMFILFLAAFINLILDPILMFESVPGLEIPGLNLGVFGAALATVISTIVSFLVGCYLLLSGKAKAKMSFRGLFQLNWEIDKKLVTIGLPSGISIFFIHFFNLLVLKLVSVYGTGAVAAMGIGKVINDFVTIPLMGLVLGGTSIVGQSLGAKQLDQIKKTITTACIHGSVLMMLATFVVYLFPETIIKFFTNDSQVIVISVTMLLITMPGLVFLGVSSGLKPAFYGAGFNLPFLTSSIISLWLVQLPFLLVVIYLFDWGLNAVWFSFILAQFVEMLVFLFLYWKGAWKTNQI